MKAIKKALAALLCLCLILGCVSVTAFAEDVKGTITIKNPTSSEATVEGKDFEIYRIFYATTDGQNTSYSWFKDKDDPKVNPFYEYFATVDDADGKPLVEAGKEPSEYSNIQRVINHINTEHPTNFALSQFAEKIHKYIVDNAIQPIDKKTGEDKKTEVVFDDLDYGYYLVYDATTFQDGTSAVRSAVMVDTVNTNIEITLKANRPELQKQVLENDGKTYGEATSSEIGETVTFKITSYIPSHEYYDAYVYYIDDTLPAGLSLDENSVNVTLTSPEGSAITTQNLYTINENKAANTFKVEFEENALIGQDKLKTDTKIEIEYTATVTSEIPFGGTTNTATLTYSNDPNVPTSIGSVQDTARVYTYMFVLTKYAIDSTGNVSATARLAGAKFKFYSVDDEGNKTLIKFAETINPKVDGDKKMYSVGGNIEEITVLDGNAPGRVTNSTYFGGNLGDITIFGLKEGTYYIEETQAPDGYVTPTDGFTITVSDTIDANGMVSTLTTTVGEHSSTGAIGNYGGESTNYLTWIDVGNTAGSQLPETGGMCTTLFTVLGIVLMAGAAAFFTSRKRSSMA